MLGWESGPVEGGLLPWTSEPVVASPYIELPALHGNSALSSRTAYLYGLYNEDGAFLKWGITQNMAKRYPRSFMANKYLDPIANGPRGDCCGWSETLLKRNPVR